MNTNKQRRLGLVDVVMIGGLAIGLAGCTGDTGSPGAAGAPGPGVAPLSTATALNFTITSASVNSAPVVNFKVTNQDGVAVAGFADTDLRFNIAKLIPGAPTKWQNYIVRASSGAMQGSQERKSSGYPWGSLVDHKDGTYTYTFCTDITKTGTADYTQCAAASQPVACPAPCTDADGNALDVSYQPSDTTRVSVQMSNSAYPKAVATFDFVPNGGAMTTTRDIVSTAQCNQCHNQLVAHGTRIDTKLCVTCHNPGSWVANGTGKPNTPVDFKVYIHKIHMGDELPSVLAGYPYAIGSSDFSDVAFPQDIRNCTKCHDGTVTANGDNWKNQPSKAACGACHDDVYFGTAPDPLKPYQTVSHMTLMGGAAVADPADTMCVQCHGAGQLEDVAFVHRYPSVLKAESAKYVLKIVSITGGTPTTSPVIKFSVTDASGTAYDINNTSAIKGGSLNLIIGWNTTDFNNTDSGVSTTSPASPLSVSLLQSGGLGLITAVTNNGDGTYSITPSSVNAAYVVPSTATGTGRVGFYGRMSVDVDNNGSLDQVPVKSVVKDFLITGTSVVARRVVVDIAKCDQCHAQLTLHGNNRTDEPQLCVMCHNPNATDTARRPATAPANTLDNKKEEAIDFKRMIHAIHGSSIRQNQFVVWGYPGADQTIGTASCPGPAYTCQHNFGAEVQFPGILNDCNTCHTTRTVGRTAIPTYQLQDIWEDPTANGILASTIDHGTSIPDPTDDMNITPTAAVCSSCHDDDLSKQHMTYTGGANFSSSQANIDSHTGSFETCSVCHGPGAIADVKVVHGVK
jgi:OmcA/MtrC family decaheme c-type cytochrome